MSDEFKEFYYHPQFDHDDHHRRSNSGGGAAAFPNSGNTLHNNMQMFDPSYLSFSEFLTGPTAQNPFPGPFDSSSVSSGSNEGKKEAKETLENEEYHESYKKDDKSKKKGADKKKQRQQQFAFMTKSEVDHLEDGYKWRKYGQKAVKNNAYPRSYYKCTTQQCSVKKRVERSFENPSIVVTTYEGQHNHHVPEAPRGRLAAGMFAPSMISSPFGPSEGPNSFPQELLGQMTHPYSYGGDEGTSNVTDPQTNGSSPRQQYNQFPDYGLLQDITSPAFPR
ncbi:WRKY transcription factor [Castilleja foliolosa]|uniref:WRKY transcription factor n=1 Tax=Castilleja foliolosa TaxID=1961234 RepID=A0ABD3DRU4_9LAMI